jgi:hypothetical protein
MKRVTLREARALLIQHGALCQENLERLIKVTEDFPFLSPALRRQIPKLFIQQRTSLELVDRLLEMEEDADITKEMLRLLKHLERYQNFSGRVIAEGDYVVAAYRRQLLTPEQLQ